MSLVLFYALAGQALFCFNFIMQLGSTYTHFSLFGFAVAVVLVDLLYGEKKIKHTNE